MGTFKYTPGKQSPDEPQRYKDTTQCFPNPQPLTFPGAGGCCRRALPTKQPSPSSLASIKASSGAVLCGLLCPLHSLWPLLCHQERERWGATGTAPKHCPSLQGWGRGQTDVSSRPSWQTSDRTTLHHIKVLWTSAWVDVGCCL